MATQSAEQEIQEIRTLLKEVILLQKETDFKFKETDLKFKETDLKFKETDQKIKEAFDLFTGQWGKLIESLVEGDIVNLLQKRGLSVHDTSTRRKGNHKGENFEFDIIVHNGDSIVIVEVKTTLRVKHVKEFVKKLKKASTWMDEYKNYKVYGAVAFLKAEENSDAFAESESLFVIRATGNSSSIMNQADFTPKIF
jgi:Holliday junction resolvase-like predicted endonuclease